MTLKQVVLQDIIWTVNFSNRKPLCFSFFLSRVSSCFHLSGSKVLADWFQDFVAEHELDLSVSVCPRASPLLRCAGACVNGRWRWLIMKQSNLRAITGAKRHFNNTMNNFVATESLMILNDLPPLTCFLFSFLFYIIYSTICKLYSIFFEGSVPETGLWMLLPHFEIKAPNCLFL